MNKLTTEQLLFAHQIGASHANDVLLKKKNGNKWYYYEEGWFPSMSTNDVNESVCEPIDFTPLYDWIDHDSGECPVRGDDYVQFSNDGGPNSGWYVASSLDWSCVKSFRIESASSSYWPEQRADAIGQNVNTGEHYADIPPPEYDPRDVAFKPKKSKYHREIAPGVWVDVYDVLKAWSVTCPALQHLIKKALQPGERGHKTLDQDMKDIVASAIRAQELASNPED